MKNKQSKRKYVLESPLYRTNLGDKLSKRRQFLCYSKADIAFILSLDVSVITKIENGEMKNIDYYVEYAKAVGYPLATLDDFNIPLTPLRELEESRIKQVLFERFLNNEVATSDFLGDEKTITEIRDFILLKEILTIEELKKINLSNRMKALVEKKLVEVRKEGNKNFYKIKG